MDGTKARWNMNTIGKGYSLEYTDIPKVIFMPHYQGHCYRGHCCTLDHSCTVIPKFLRFVIFALMWSQVTVAEQWAKKYCIPGFHCCAMGCNNRTSTLIIAKYAIHRKTDEHGGAHKLIFAHSRAWRHLKTFDIIRWNQLRQKKIKAVNKWQANGQKVV
jgi:hypothetical protein